MIWFFVRYLAQDILAGVFRNIDWSLALGKIQASFQFTANMST